MTSAYSKVTAKRAASTLIPTDTNLVRMGRLRDSRRCTVDRMKRVLAINQEQANRRMLSPLNSPDLSISIAKSTATSGVEKARNALNKGKSQLASRKRPNQTKASLPRPSTMGNDKMSSPHISPIQLIGLEREPKRPRFANKNNNNVTISTSNCRLNRYQGHSPTTITNAPSGDLDRLYQPLHPSISRHHQPQSPQQREKSWVIGIPPSPSLLPLPIPLPPTTLPPSTSSHRALDASGEVSLRPAAQHDNHSHSPPFGFQNPLGEQQRLQWSKGGGKVGKPTAAPGTQLSKIDKIPLPLTQKLHRCYSSSTDENNPPTTESSSNVKENCQAVETAGVGTQPGALQGRRRRRGHSPDPPSPSHSFAVTTEGKADPYPAKGHSAYPGGVRAFAEHDFADRPPRPPSFKKPLGVSAIKKLEHKAEEQRNANKTNTMQSGDAAASVVAYALHSKGDENVPRGSGGGTSAAMADQLEKVLRSESARAPFHQFLQQQFCAENINFYLAVEEYRNIFKEDAGRRAELGRMIFDRHFAPNCIEPINIDNSTANSIREACRLNNFTPDLYDLVQYQIFHMLKYDCWPRYLRANGGTVEELGSGDTSRLHSIASGSGGARAVEQLRQFQQCSSDVPASASKCNLQPRYITPSSSDDNDEEITSDEEDREEEFFLSTSSESSDDESSAAEELHHLSRHSHPTSSRTGEKKGAKKKKGQRKALLFRLIHRRGRVEKEPRTATDAASISSTVTRRSDRAGRGEDAGGRQVGRGSVENPNSAQQQIHRWPQHHYLPSQKRRSSSLNRMRAGDHQLRHRNQQDFPAKYCTLLCGDATNSSEIALTDQLQSVRQWTLAIAESCGLDGNAAEVVDAQSGCTIDPARQAVDALNSRTVRIMPVVRFPVIFLSLTTQGKPPVPAKVVILRSRLALTVGKVLRPIMAKYNVDPEHAVVCVASTCDVVKATTPISSIYHKTLTVLNTHQQWAERKLLAKKETQKELTLAPAWMVQPEQTNLLFHQHGDVGFCEVPMDGQEGRGGGGGLLQKHNATRSYSSNPREFFKFGRKPSHARNVRGGGDAQGADADESAFASSGSYPLGQQQHGKPGLGSPFPSSFPSSAVAASSSSRPQHSTSTKQSKGSFSLVRGGSDRRKSLGAQRGSNNNNVPSTSAPAAPVTPKPSMAAGMNPLAAGLIAPSDIPYCGEDYSSSGGTPASGDFRPATHTALYPSKSTGNATTVSFGGGRGYAYEIPEFLQQTATTSTVSGDQALSSDNFIRTHLPAIYTSSIRSLPMQPSDKATPSPETAVSVESGLTWQKADYV